MLRVLVVDYEPLIRWAVTETLTPCGYAVTEAGDGASAVRAVCHECHCPDVILLDYQLPDSNDLELLATIRRAAPGAQVILMTAHGTPELARSALDLGAYCVVSKPFDVHDLTVLVEQAHASRVHAHLRPRPLA